MEALHQVFLFLTIMMFSSNKHQSVIICHFKMYLFSLMDKIYKKDAYYIAIILLLFIRGIYSANDDASVVV
jgi:hypothetical protein